MSASFKIHGISQKWIHRRVAKRFLPDQIIKRRKLGFATPVEYWLHDSVANQMETMLLGNDSLIYEYLEPDEVKHLMDEHRQRRANNYKILFSIVMLEEWLRTFIA